MIVIDSINGYLKNECSEIDERYAEMMKRGIPKRNIGRPKIYSKEQIKQHRTEYMLKKSM